MIQETSMQSSIWYTKLWVDPSNCALCNLCVPNLGLRPLLVLAVTAHTAPQSVPAVCISSCQSVCTHKSTHLFFLFVETIKVHEKQGKSSIWRNGMTEELIKLACIHHAKHCQFKIRSVGCLAPGKVKRSNVYLNKPLCLCTHSVSVLLWRRKVTLTLSLSLIHIWRCRRDPQCRSRWSPYH